MANTIVVVDRLQRELIALKEERKVISQFANTDFEGTIRQAGDTVRIQQVPFLRGDVVASGSTTAARAASGETIATQDWAVESFTLPITEVYNEGILIKDIEEIQSNITLQDKFAERMAEASRQVEDQFVASLFTDAASRNKLQDKNPLTLSDTNTYSAVTSLTEALENSNAYGEAVVLVSPSIHRRFRLENILDSSSLGLDTRYNGMIGMLDGFRVVQTNNLPHVRTLTVDTQPTANDTFVLTGLIKDSSATQQNAGRYRSQTVTFTFVAAPSNPGEIDIGATLADTQANIINAINGTGTPGATSYIELTAANRAALRNAFTQVTDTAFNASDQITIRNSGGPFGGALAYTETFTAGTNVFGSDAVLMTAMLPNSIYFAAQMDQLKLETESTGGMFARLLHEKVYGGSLVGENTLGVSTIEVIA